MVVLISLGIVLRLLGLWTETSSQQSTASTSGLGRIQKQLILSSEDDLTNHEIKTEMDIVDDQENSTSQDDLREHQGDEEAISPYKDFIPKRQSQRTPKVQHIVERYDTEGIPTL